MYDDVVTHPLDFHDREGILCRTAVGQIENSSLQDVISV